MSRYVEKNDEEDWDKKIRGMKKIDNSDTGYKSKYSAAKWKINPTHSSKKSL